MGKWGGAVRPPLLWAFAMQHQTLSSSARVQSDRPCVGCGYNLRGLEVTGACPECATAVRLSMSDPLLRYSAPAHLASLHRGAVMVELSILLVVVGVPLAILLAMLVTWASNGVLRVSIRSSAVEMAGGGFWLATSIVSLWGWWLISTPDPALAPGAPGWRSRGVLRVGVAIQFAAALLSFASDTAAAIITRNAAGVATAAIIGGMVDAASGLAWVVSFFAAMTYVGHLARRIPDATLDSYARTMRGLGWTLVGGWGTICAMVILSSISDTIAAALGAITGVTACFGLPLLVIISLVALIAYIVLIDRLRSILKQVRVFSELERAATAADPSPAVTTG